MSNAYENITLYKALTVPENISPPLRISVTHEHNLPYLLVFM